MPDVLGQPDGANATSISPSNCRALLRSPPARRKPNACARTLPSCWRSARTTGNGAQQYDGEALQTIVAVMRDKTESATLRARSRLILA
jgi:hypothetical protein